MELRFDQHLVMLLHKYNCDKENVLYIELMQLWWISTTITIVNGFSMEKESCRTDILSELEHNLNTKQLIHLQAIAKMKIISNCAVEYLSNYRVQGKSPVRGRYFS